MSLSSSAIARGRIAQIKRVNGAISMDDALERQSPISSMKNPVECPYCPMTVEADYFSTHCAEWHENEALIEVALQVRNHIFEANEHVFEAGRLIALVNQQLAHKGTGTFTRWIKAELGGLSRSQAYNLMTVYKRFSERPIIGQTLERTALFTLMNASESAITEVETLIGEGETPDSKTTKIIVKAHKAAAELAAQYGIDDAQTIGALTDLAKTNMPLLLTIRDTGYVQPGNESEAVHITSDPRAVVKAINQIKRDQIQLHQKPDTINLSEFTRDELTQIQYHAEKLGALMDGCESAYALLVKLSDLNTGAKALLKS